MGTRPGLQHIFWGHNSTHYSRILGGETETGRRPHFYNFVAQGTGFSSLKEEIRSLRLGKKHEDDPIPLLARMVF